MQGVYWCPAQTECHDCVVSTDTYAEVPLWIFIWKTDYLKIFRGFPPVLQENVCVLQHAGTSRLLPVHYAGRSFPFKDVSCAVE